MRFVWLSICHTSNGCTPCKHHTCPSTTFSFALPPYLKKGNKMGAFYLLPLSSQPHITYRCRTENRARWGPVHYAVLFPSLPSCCLCTVTSWIWHRTVSDVCLAWPQKTHNLLVAASHVFLTRDKLKAQALDDFAKNRRNNVFLM